MATLTQNLFARPFKAVTAPKGLLDKYFYFSMSLLIAAIVVWGFSHTIDANLFHPTVPRPTILWFHAAAFSTWVAFFIVQSALVRTRNVKIHKLFGWFGVGLGTTMVILGIVTSIIMSRFDKYRLHEPGVDAFLIVPIYDMLAFGAFFALAILWRKKPELHRRLIFIATCCLLDAAFGRVDYIYTHGLFYYCLDGVILLGVLRDLVVSHRVHKVYLIALPALLVTQIFVVHTWQSSSAWWLRTAHAILG